MFTPSRASDMAHAYHSPRLEEQTTAFRHLIRRSVGPSSTSRPCLRQLRGDWEARGKDRAANRLALRGADGGEWRAPPRGGGGAGGGARPPPSGLCSGRRRGGGKPPPPAGAGAVAPAAAPTSPSALPPTAAP